jgi:hypothetical protein
MLRHAITHSNTPENNIIKKPQSDIDIKNGFRLAHQTDVRDRSHRGVRERHENVIAKVVLGQKNVGVCCWIRHP